MFKQRFKYYKAKKPPPSLEDVMDFNKIPIINPKIEKIGISSTFHKYGLIPSNEWEVFRILQKPGLVYIKNPFTKLGERYWTIRCLRDFTRQPNKRNIDAHDVIDDGKDWWECSKGDRDVLKRLRWSTLGYHHNWDTKVYSEDSKNDFPEDLNELCSLFANALGFKDFNAEAAIVNFYHLDSTLSGHTDHSEQNLEAPLFSFSFGNSAIFLLGGETLDEDPLPLLLHSGDVVVMSKESRLCYHGVPKILHSWIPNIAAESLKQPPGCSGLWKDSADDSFWLPFKNYLSMSRINLNVRQVLRRGQKRLINNSDWWRFIFRKRRTV